MPPLVRITPVNQPRIKQQTSRAVSLERSREEFKPATLAESKNVGKEPLSTSNQQISLKRKRGRPRLHNAPVSFDAVSSTLEEQRLHAYKLEAKLGLNGDRSPATSKSITPITFPNFRCGWRNCPAELHSLETLRLHVKQKHGKQPINSVWPCNWSNCGEEYIKKNLRTLKESREIKPETFSNFEKWLEHMEDYHIDSISWELGSGATSAEPEKIKHTQENGLTKFQTKVAKFAASSLALIPATKSDSLLPKKSLDPTRKLLQEAKVEFAERQQKRKTDGRNGQFTGPFMEREGSALVTKDLRNAFNASSGGQTEQGFSAVSVIDMESEPAWQEWDNSMAQLVKSDI